MIISYQHCIKCKDCFFYFKNIYLTLHTKREMDINSLFKTYYRPLCLYAMHYLNGDTVIAEDIVQESFVKMWQCKPKNNKAFLYSAVHNACIDHIRKNKATLTEILPQDIDGAISDEDAQTRSFTEARLWTAIDDLPEGMRKVLLMSKRDGMKYREIAEELGISEKTVEHHIASAMKKLKGKKKDILFVITFYF